MPRFPASNGTGTAGLAKPDQCLIHQEYVMSIRRFTSWQTPVRTAVAAAAVVAIVLPITAQTQSATEIYQQERANCLSGNTIQSRADCLYEARSVLRDRRAGDLEPSDANAVATPSGNTGSMDALPARADRH
ncbi:hypothetical protein ASC91_26920 [Pelomonas sp. Root1237]|nr:hypothetical protein ASC91_26920 [Pelomonas sp. Root1237]